MYLFCLLSSKRKEEYKEFLEFTQVDPMKIIKHCTTRWLSLHQCVGRTLHLWPALQSYFNSHKEAEKRGRVQRVAQLLADPETKLYFQFLDFILAPLVSFNTTFQVSKISSCNYIHLIIHSIVISMFDLHNILM